MPFDPEPYNLLLGLLNWLAIFGTSVGVVLALVIVGTWLRWGTAGPASVIRQIIAGFEDWRKTSLRRVWTLAQLTIKEAIHRKVLLVFAIFIVLFMFAGWFLADAAERPELQTKAYISFVLTAIGWLMLPVVLLLACWGLPEDIKARSLHTVVTKAVRRHEILLGRILGFTVVTTLVLVIVGVSGYFWILRQVPPEVQKELVARVPIHGELQFLNRMGQPVSEGLNVGYRWEHRGYIDGATQSRAIWTFENVTPERLGDELVLESRFEAFRTHKGDIGRTITGQFTLVNEDRDLRVPVMPPFQVKEFKYNLTRIGRTLTYRDPETGSRREVDLFEDLAPDGTLRVEVACLDRGQLLGMARPDLFIRLPNRSFASGYFKSIFGVWLMMALVTTLGVTASCFVKGPVATFLTFSFVVIGQWFREFMEALVRGQTHGGGPLESIVRIVTHMNLMDPLEAGPLTTVVKTVDAGILHVLWIVQYLIPDFSHYSRIMDYIPNGFDVSFQSALLPGIAVAAGYLVPCLLLGYYTLKLRELEAK